MKPPINFRRSGYKIKGISVPDHSNSNDPLWNQQMRYEAALRNYKEIGSRNLCGQKIPKDLDNESEDIDILEFYDEVRISTVLPRLERSSKAFKISHNHGSLDQSTRTPLGRPFTIQRPLPPPAPLPVSSSPPSKKEKLSILRISRSKKKETLPAINNRFSTCRVDCLRLANSIYGSYNKEEYKRMTPLFGRKRYF